MRKKWKRIFSAALAGIVMCTAITFYPTEVKAAEKAATDVWEGVSSADWMSGIDGSTKLPAINLPGTHDSTTKNVDNSSLSKCQDKSIAEQLKLGIRYLDMRFDGQNAEAGKLNCVHSSSKCYNDKGEVLELQEVLDDCYAFLKEHPTETIVMRMKEDNGSIGDKELQTRVHNYINKNPGYWYVENRTPSLDEVRGKIVLARFYSHGWAVDAGVGGLNFSGWKSDESRLSVPNPPYSLSTPPKDGQGFDADLYVQDCYNLGTTFTNNKWKAVETSLNYAKTITNPNEVYFLNYLSSAASAPSSTASAVNPKFLSYTMEYGANYGWIVMDFATEELAKHVYTSNKSPKREAINATMEALSIPATVENDMLLPTTGEAVGGAAGTSITWSCDPANALSTIGDKFILTRQSSEQNVTLTATVSSGNCSKKKEFQVQVPKLPEDFAELDAVIKEAEAILSDPENAKYDLDALEAAVETARTLLLEDADKVSETQISAAMETLNTIQDRGLALKSAEKLRENLLAWYPLTVSSKDVSGNHNNGTAIGVTFDKTNGAKFSGGSARTSYINLPAAMFKRTADNNNLTVSFWVKDDRGAKSNAFGFGNGTQCNPNNGGSKHFIVNTNDGGNLLVNACPNGWAGNTNKITTAAPSTGTWTHLAVVMEGNKMSLYQNGTAVKTVTADYSLAEMGNIAFAYIGNAIYAHNGDADFKGSIKDFRVYDCAIASELIEKIYNDKDVDVSADSGHLIARYPLTADSKNVAGKGNDGVATGVTFSPANGATFTDGGKKESYISLPTAMFDGEEQMTFSFWAKDTKSSGSNTVFGIGSGTEKDGNNSAGVFKYVLINTNNNRNLKAVITKNTWRDERGFNGTECSFPANEWVHVTCVFDGTKFALYKNGALIGSKDTSIKLTDIGTNTVAYIGNSIWTMNDVDYSGSVKDFRIYDCALSEAEAKGIMNESIKDEVMTDLMGALDLDITKGEDGSLSMSITDAITLPTTVNGGTITWSSDKTDVIDNTGKVILPGADQDLEDVTLTATVTINGKQTEVTFHCEVFTKRDDISTADLQAIISSAETTTEGLNQADYTASSWNAYQEALNTAKQQMKKPTSEGDVKAAADDLQAKKNAFVKLGDKTNLNALINTVKSLKKAEYTTASWTEFEAALTAAEEAAKSNDVTQDDVDTAKDNLSAKKDALEKRGDKTNLNAAIAAAEALDQEDYTTETWEPFQETLTEVKKTAGNDASEEEVKEAERSLDAAVKALKKITYTVTFNPDNGSSDITRTVERKDKVSAPEEPKKDGYIFDGWFEANAQEAFDLVNTPIMSNVTLTAKWVIKRTVTFDPDNGSDTWAVPVKDGGKVSKPASIPKKDGYGFEYWYAEGEERAFDFTNREITADITLKAKWTEGGHTVVFNPDNGSDTWEVFVKDGEKVSMPDATLEKEGYEFEYWCAEGENGAFDFANREITEDITLTAKWKAKQGEEDPGDNKQDRVVTFNPDNGSDTWTETVKDGEKVSMPDAAPEKAGYEFEYWYAEGEDSAFDFANREITADITLIAKWKKTQGDDKPDPVSITSAKIKLSKTTLTYNGKAQKPKVTVTYNGKKLTAGTDYTVSYSNNKKVGQGSVKIAGKGNYNGQKTAKFTIMPQTNKISKLTNKAGKKLVVKLGKTTKKTGAKGYEISYSTKKNFKGAKKVKTTKTSYTLKKLKKGKTYYVRVRSYAKIGKKTKYSAYSKAVKKKVTK